MAMNRAFKNLVLKTRDESRVFLEHTGKLAQLDTLWAGPPDYQSLITQAQIDSDPGFLEAGLTQQQLADALFALATINTNIENALVALTMLASLPS